MLRSRSVNKDGATDRQADPGVRSVSKASADGGDSVYIAWARFQRRQISMAGLCGFEPVFLPVQRPVSRVRKGFVYLRNAWLTWSLLRQRRPDVIWMQLPQVPLMWVALFYRFFARAKPVLVADCHNAMFRAPWSEVPMGVRLLSKCDIVIAHTDEMMKTANSLGVPSNRLIVIGDPPADIVGASTTMPALAIKRPWVVFPASFSDDEPIEEVIEAARLTPDVSVLITGDYVNLDKLQLHAKAPANARFLGFLSREDFDNLIVHCDAVIAFTRLEGLQMSVCGEAVGCQKPMLISNTRTLRRMFPVGGVFVDSANPDAIAVGLHSLITNHAALSEQAATLNAQMREAWRKSHAPSLLSRIRVLRA